MSWTPDGQRSIAAADDLHVAPLREDSVTFGTPTWIWSVMVDSQMYIRAYNGRNSRWYQAARQQGRGQVTVAGRTWEVTFEPVETTDDLQPQIDEAYRAKYAHSPYLNPMTSERTRAATLRVVPTSVQP